jgi:hypothetical protein
VSTPHSCASPGPEPDRSLPRAKSCGGRVPVKILSAHFLCNRNGNPALPAWSSRIQHQHNGSQEILLVMHSHPSKLGIHMGQSRKPRALRNTNQGSASIVEPLSNTSGTLIESRPPSKARLARHTPSKGFQPAPIVNPSRGGTAHQHCRLWHIRCPHSVSGDLGLVQC